MLLLLPVLLNIAPAAVSTRSQTATQASQQLDLIVLHTCCMQCFSSSAQSAVDMRLSEMFHMLQFWELDNDHDFLISKDDLVRYGNHSLTYRIVERIFLQVCLAACHA